MPLTNTCSPTTLEAWLNLSHYIIEGGAHPAHGKTTTTHPFTLRDEQSPWPACSCSVGGSQSSQREPTQAHGEPARWEQRGPCPNPWPYRASHWTTAGSKWKTPPVASQRFTLDIQAWLKPDLTMTAAIVCHLSFFDWQLETDIKSPSFPWNTRRWDTASKDQGPSRGAIYTIVVESYWNVVQITICVFLALALVVCGYFGQCARGETGRRSVLGRELDDWEPQTSEIPHCRWSALCPQDYFSIPFLESFVKKNTSIKKSLLIYPQMCQRYTIVVPVSHWESDCQSTVSAIQK